MTYTDHFLVGLLDFFRWAEIMLIAAFVLTLADLKYGLDAAKHRKETIKRSRAVRRTFDKITNYIFWIVIAYTFGQAFGNPFGIDILPITILLIIYGVELESIFTNYFFTKGKNLKVNIFAFFSKKASIIETEEKKDNNETKQ